MEMPTKANNQVNLLHIKRDKHGIWWFDDKDLKINHEVFVGDINTMIDMYSDGDNELLVYISKDPIAKETLSLNRIYEEGEGMYQLNGTEVIGWLCPCLLNYFPEYVENIHVKIQKL